MIPREQWEWYGIAGHLIVGSNCQFHLLTGIGDVLVSTVGEYLPEEASREIHADVRGVTLEGRGDARRADFMQKFGWVEIGAGRTYETMVFRTSGQVCVAKDCDCGLPLIEDWTELEADGYSSRGAAHAGHYAMCERWADKGSRTS